MDKLHRRKYLQDEESLLPIDDGDIDVDVDVDAQEEDQDDAEHSRSETNEDVEPEDDKKNRKFRPNNWDFLRRQGAMPLTDVLQRHWKKLALLGLVVAIGICVAIGLAVSNDVEQPEDEQAPEGGNPGAQIGNGPPPNSGSGKVEIIGGVRVPPKLREFNKEKTVPNFFERTRDPATGELTPPDSHYRGGTAVFLQNQNSGGQLMKLCMNKIFKDKQSSLQPTIVTKDSFDSFYDNLKQKDANTIPKTVVGDCVLGTCEYTPEDGPAHTLPLSQTPSSVRLQPTLHACPTEKTAKVWTPKRPP
ncbi:uncharacterized protein [Ptychodera flava]|uniref:uncharacterized protein n=1 Tax=Ptychodera flava TaxID=63121 RepID=UPI00396A7DAB